MIAPVPTKFLKNDFLPILQKTITNIANSSFQSGKFPSVLKTAMVTPLLKKANLDKDVLKNYCPISNIPFLSKVLEKVAAKQIYQHLEQNGMSEKLQSAYKPLHSTETALLRIQNDILTGLNDKTPSGVFLVLIDLSAAFDTVDHHILLDFLRDTLGIKGSALKWIETYLCNRTQQVSIDGILSALIELLFGVPQGSVLGPLKFCMYTLPLGAILRYHRIGYHIYADDTQLYL